VNGNTSHLCTFLSSTDGSSDLGPGTWEGQIGEWNTVFEDEVEGRWVTIKVYASADDEDADEGPLVRVTAAPIEDVEDELVQSEGGQKSAAKREIVGSAITLEPDPIEDLEEELIEIGFSPEAATWIAGKIPE
jgi:hypothetical protein